MVGGKRFEKATDAEATAERTSYGDVLVADVLGWLMGGEGAGKKKRKNDIAFVEEHHSGRGGERKICCGGHKIGEQGGTRK